VTIPVYRCPNDPSTTQGANAPGNYATNDLVFNARPGTLVSLPASVPAGASNTIFFAEKYAACSNWATIIDGSPLGCFKPAYTAHESAPVPFQVLPRLSACDCALPQAAHGSILVGMGDGSVRSVHPSISSALWYAGNDPNGAGLPAD